MCQSTSFRPLRLNTMRHTETDTWEQCIHVTVPIHVAKNKQARNTCDQPAYGWHPLLLANTCLFTASTDFAFVDSDLFCTLSHIADVLDVNILSSSLPFFFKHSRFDPHKKLIYTLTWKWYLVFCSFMRLRRLSESQFKHSLSRDSDVFSRRDSTTSTSNPGTPNSPGAHSTPSRDSVFEIGSNTLPRGKRV